MAGEELSAELDEAMREHRLFRSIPRCYLDLEGRPRALRVSGKPNRDGAGRHIGWRGTATDVTVEIEARKTAEFLSGHDALTGMLNRQGLIEGTTKLLEVARRRNQLAAFLLLDLDRFKEVNDVHGPIVGDQLIRAIAQKLANLAQPGDVDRPARRRRVRAGPSRHPRGAGGAAAGQVPPGRAGAAIADRRPGDRGQRQCRRDHAAERSRLGGARAAHGGDGDDPRQGGRPIGATLLRAGHGCAAPGAQGARARHGQGDRESRVRGVLSAQAERAHARAVRRRGADPLAPSAAWADRTGAVHPGGRGDPHDRPDRPLGARAGLPRRRRVGRRPGGGQLVARPIHR